MLRCVHCGVTATVREPESIVTRNTMTKATVMITTKSKKDVLFSLDCMDVPLHYIIVDGDSELLQQPDRELNKHKNTPISHDSVQQYASLCSQLQRPPFATSVISIFFVLIM
jgi:hypothetical protein